MIQTLFQWRLFKAIALTVVVTFLSMIPAETGFAQLLLPKPGEMVLPTASFTPTLMSGIRIDPKDPFNFNFVMSNGQGQKTEDSKKEEYKKLVRYFMAALVIPNADMWVNLSPHEANRIIPDGFSMTEMGRDLLAQDYLLKQLTSSLMYPEGPAGHDFWQQIYQKSFETFGTTNIPVNTFNKVWIVPDSADVYQKDDTVLLIKSHLKVMLEQDFMALENNRERFVSAPALDNSVNEGAQKIMQEMVRQVILPVIEKEVNEGESFAQLRQAYHCMILATWFKKNLKNSLLNQVYVDKRKVAGINLNDASDKDRIYKEYLEAYKNGVFGYIKEEYDTFSQETLPRKYFAGGILAIDDAMIHDVGYSEALRHIASQAKNYFMAGVRLTSVTGARFLSPQTSRINPVSAPEGARQQLTLRLAVLRLLGQEIKQQLEKSRIAAATALDRLALYQTTLDAARTIYKVQRTRFWGLIAVVCLSISSAASAGVLAGPPALLPSSDVLLVRQAASFVASSRTAIVIDRQTGIAEERSIILSDSEFHPVPAKLLHHTIQLGNHTRLTLERGDLIKMVKYNGTQLGNPTSDGDVVAAIVKHQKAAKARSLPAATPPPPAKHRDTDLRLLSPLKPKHETTYAQRATRSPFLPPAIAHIYDNKLPDSVIQRLTELYGMAADPLHKWEDSVESEEAPSVKVAKGQLQKLLPKVIELGYTLAMEFEGKVPKDVIKERFPNGADIIAKLESMGVFSSTGRFHSFVYSDAFKVEIIRAFPLEPWVLGLVSYRGDRGIVTVDDIKRSGFKEDDLRWLHQNGFLLEENAKLDYGQPYPVSEEASARLKAKFGEDAKRMKLLLDESRDRTVSRADFEKRFPGLPHLWEDLRDRLHVFQESVGDKGLHFRSTATIYDLLKANYPTGFHEIKEELEKGDWRAARRAKAKEDLKAAQEEASKDVEAWLKQQAEDRKNALAHTEVKERSNFYIALSIRNGVPSPWPVPKYSAFSFGPSWLGATARFGVAFPYAEPVQQFQTAQQVLAGNVTGVNLYLALATLSDYALEQVANYQLRAYANKDGKMTSSYLVNANKNTAEQLACLLTFGHQDLYLSDAKGRERLGHVEKWNNGVASTLKRMVPYALSEIFGKETMDNPVGRLFGEPGVPPPCLDNGWKTHYGTDQMNFLKLSQWGGPYVFIVKKEPLPKDRKGLRELMRSVDPGSEEAYLALAAEGGGIEKGFVVNSKNPLEAYLAYTTLLAPEQPSVSIKAYKGARLAAIQALISSGVLDKDKVGNVFIKHLKDDVPQVSDPWLAGLLRQLSGKKNIKPEIKVLLSDAEFKEMRDLQLMLLNGKDKNGRKILAVMQNMAGRPIGVYTHADYIPAPGPTDVGDPSKPVVASTKAGAEMMDMLYNYYEGPPRDDIPIGMIVNGNVMKFYVVGEEDEFLNAAFVTDKKNVVFGANFKPRGSKGMGSVFHFDTKQSHPVTDATGWPNLVPKHIEFSTPPPWKASGPIHPQRQHVTLPGRDQNPGETAAAFLGGQLIDPLLQAGANFGIHLDEPPNPRNGTRIAPGHLHPDLVAYFKAAADFHVRNHLEGKDLDGVAKGPKDPVTLYGMVGEQLRLFFPGEQYESLVRASLRPENAGILFYFDGRMPQVATTSDFKKMTPANFAIEKGASNVRPGKNEMIVITVNGQEIAVGPETMLNVVGGNAIGFLDPSPRMTQHRVLVLAALAAGGVTVRDLRERDNPSEIVFAANNDVSEDQKAAGIHPSRELVGYIASNQIVIEGVEGRRIFTRNSLRELVPNVTEARLDEMIYELVKVKNYATEESPGVYRIAPMSSQRIGDIVSVLGGVQSERIEHFFDPRIMTLVRKEDAPPMKLNSDLKPKLRDDMTWGELMREVAHVEYGGSYELTDINHVRFREQLKDGSDVSKYILSLLQISRDEVDKVSERNLVMALNQALTSPYFILRVHSTLPAVGAMGLTPESKQLYAILVGGERLSDDETTRLNAEVLEFYFKDSVQRGRERGQFVPMSIFSAGSGEAWNIIRSQAKKISLYRTGKNRPWAQMEKTWRGFELVPESSRREFLTKNLRMVPQYGGKSFYVSLADAQNKNLHKALAEMSGGLAVERQDAQLRTDMSVWFNPANPYMDAIALIEIAPVSPSDFGPDGETIVRGLLANNFLTADLKPKALPPVEMLRFKETYPVLWPKLLPVLLKNLSAKSLIYSLNTFNPDIENKPIAESVGSVLADGTIQVTTTDKRKINEGLVVVDTFRIAELRLELVSSQRFRHKVTNYYRTVHGALRKDFPYYAVSMTNEGVPLAIRLNGTADPTTVQNVKVYYSSNPFTNEGFYIDLGNLKDNGNVASVVWTRMDEFGRLYEKRTGFLKLDPQEVYSADHIAELANEVFKAGSISPQSASEHGEFSERDEYFYKENGEQDHRDVSRWHNGKWERAWEIKGGDLDYPSSLISNLIKIPAIQKAFEKLGITPETVFVSSYTENERGVKSKVLRVQGSAGEESVITLLEDTGLQGWTVVGLDFDPQTGESLRSLTLTPDLQVAYESQTVRKGEIAEAEARLLKLDWDKLKEAFLSKGWGSLATDARGNLDSSRIRVNSGYVDEMPAEMQTMFEGKLPRLVQKKLGQILPADIRDTYRTTLERHLGSVVELERGLAGMGLNFETSLTGVIKTPYELKTDAPADPHDYMDDIPKIRELAQQYRRVSTETERRNIIRDIQIAVRNLLGEGGNGKTLYSDVQGPASIEYLVPHSPDGKSIVIVSPTNNKKGESDQTVTLNLWPLLQHPQLNIAGSRGFESTTVDTDTNVLPGAMTLDSNGKVISLPILRGTIDQPILMSNSGYRTFVVNLYNDLESIDERGSNNTAGGKPVGLNFPFVVNRVMNATPQTKNTRVEILMDPKFSYPVPTVGFMHDPSSYFAAHQVVQVPLRITYSTDTQTGLQRSVTITLERDATDPLQYRVYETERLGTATVAKKERGIANAYWNDLLSLWWTFFGGFGAFVTLLGVGAALRFFKKRAALRSIPAETTRLEGDWKNRNLTEDGKPIPVPDSFQEPSFHGYGIDPNIVSNAKNVFTSSILVPLRQGRGFKRVFDDNFGKYRVWLYENMGVRRHADYLFGSRQGTKIVQWLEGNNFFEPRAEIVRTGVSKFYHGLLERFNFEKKAQPTPYPRELTPESEQLIRTNFSEEADRIIAMLKQVRQRGRFDYGLDELEKLPESAAQERKDKEDAITQRKQEIIEDLWLQQLVYSSSGALSNDNPNVSCYLFEKTREARARYRNADGIGAFIQKEVSRLHRMIHLQSTTFQGLAGGSAKHELPYDIYLKTDDINALFGMVGYCLYYDGLGYTLDGDRDGRTLVFEAFYQELEAKVNALKEALQSMNPALDGSAYRVRRRATYDTLEQYKDYVDFFQRWQRGGWRVDAMVREAVDLGRMTSLDAEALQKDGWIDERGVPLKDSNLKNIKLPLSIREELIAGTGIERGDLIDKLRELGLIADSSMISIKEDVWAKGVRLEDAFTPEEAAKVRAMINRAVKEQDLRKKAVVKEIEQVKLGKAVKGFENKPVMIKTFSDAMSKNSFWRIGLKSAMNAIRTQFRPILYSFLLTSAALLGLLVFKGVITVGLAFGAFVAALVILWAMYDAVDSWLEGGVGASTGFSGATRNFAVGVMLVAIPVLGVLVYAGLVTLASAVVTFVVIGAVLAGIWEKLHRWLEGPDQTGFTGTAKIRFRTSFPVAVVGTVLVLATMFGIVPFASACSFVLVFASIMSAARRVAEFLHNDLGETFFGKVVLPWEGFNKVPARKGQIYFRIAFWTAFVCLKVAWNVFMFSYFLVPGLETLGASYEPFQHALNWNAPLEITMWIPPMFFFYLDMFAIYYILQSFFSYANSTRLGLGIVKTAGDIQRLQKGKKLDPLMEIKILPKGVGLTKAQREEFLENLKRAMSKTTRDRDSISDEVADELLHDNYRHLKGEAEEDFALFVNSLLMEMPDMPHFDDIKIATFMVPVFGEDIIYAYDETDNLPTSLDVEINTGFTNLNYLITRYRDEWVNFIQRMKREGIATDDELVRMRELMGRKGRLGNVNAQLRMQIRLWASNRGQPFARTLDGMMNYVRALQLLAKVSHPEWDDQRVQEEVNKKCQLLWAYQIWGDVMVAGASKPDQVSKRNDTHFLLKKYKEELGFDVELASIQVKNKVFHKVLSRYDGNFGEKNGAAKFGAGSLNVEFLRDALKGVRASDVLLRSLLGTDAEGLKSIAEQDFVNVLNGVLKLRDFHDQVKGDYDSRRLDRDIQDLLQRAIRSDASLNDQDFVRLNRAIIEVIYPQIEKTPSKFNALFDNKYLGNVLKVSSEQDRERSAIWQGLVEEGWMDANGAFLQEVEGRTRVGSMEFDKEEFTQASLSPEPLLEAIHKLGIETTGETPIDELNSALHSPKTAVALLNTVLAGASFPPKLVQLIKINEKNPSEEDRMRLTRWVLQLAFKGICPARYEFGLARSRDDREKIYKQILEHVLVDIYDIKMTEYHALVGEGKPGNQTNARTFAKGEILFTYDMNMDLTLMEALKVPILMEEFNDPTVAIVGYPEIIMTTGFSLEGASHGIGDRTFNSVDNPSLELQNVRYHYGHPDAWRASVAKSIGGVSSTSHVNEDIIAGIMAQAQGNRIMYVQYIQAKKARELSFSGVDGITRKFGMGAAQQMLARFTYYLQTTYLDPFEVTTHHYGGPGFYFKKPIVGFLLLSYVTIVMYLGISLFAAFPSPLVMTLTGLLILGQAIVIKAYFQKIMERGLYRGTREFLPVWIFMTGFFMAHVYTAQIGFLSALMGLAAYVPTGRGFNLEHLYLDQLFKSYGKSHMLQGLIGVVISMLAIQLWWNPTLIASAPFIMIYFFTMIMPIATNPGSLPVRGTDFRTWLRLMRQDAIRGARLIRRCFEEGGSRRIATQFAMGDVNAQALLSRVSSGTRAVDVFTARQLKSIDSGRLQFSDRPFWELDVEGSVFDPKSSNYLFEQVYQKRVRLKQNVSVRENGPADYWIRQEYNLSALAGGSLADVKRLLGIGILNRRSVEAAGLNWNLLSARLTGGIVEQDDVVRAGYSWETVVSKLTDHTGAGPLGMQIGASAVLLFGDPEDMEDQVKARFGRDAVGTMLILQKPRQKTWGTMTSDGNIVLSHDPLAEADAMRVAFTEPEFRYIYDVFHGYRLNNEVSVDDLKAVMIKNAALEETMLSPGAGNTIWERGSREGVVRIKANVEFRDGKTLEVEQSVDELVGSSATNAFMAERLRSIIADLQSPLDPIADAIPERYLVGLLNNVAERIPDDVFGVFSADEVLAIRGVRGSALDPICPDSLIWDMVTPGKFRMKEGVRMRGSDLLVDSSRRLGLSRASPDSVAAIRSLWERSRDARAVLNELNEEHTMAWEKYLTGSQGYDELRAEEFDGEYSISNLVGALRLAGFRSIPGTLEELATSQDFRNELSEKAKANDLKLRKRTVELIQQKTNNGQKKLLPKDVRDILALNFPELVPKKNADKKLLGQAVFRRSYWGQLHLNWSFYRLIDGVVYSFLYVLVWGLGTIVLMATVIPAKAVGFVVDKVSNGIGMVVSALRPPRTVDASQNEASGTPPPVTATVDAAAASHGPDDTETALRAEVDNAQRFAEAHAREAEALGTLAAYYEQRANAAAQPPAEDKTPADASAVAAGKSDLGGIDMDGSHLTINIRVDGNGLPLPAQYQDAAMVNIQGLMPELHTVAPVSAVNMPVLAELLQASGTAP